MKKKSLIIFSLLIVGLFIFSSMVPLVSAGDVVNNYYSDVNDKITTGTSDFWENTKDFFLNIGGGYDSDNQAANLFAKLLMIFIVSALVYTVLDFLKIFPEEAGTKKYEWIKWLVSVGVGILAFLFVNLETISDLVRQYEALGITLTVILPAIIVIVFAFRLKAKAFEGDESGGIVQKILSNGVLGIYFIYMISIVWGEGHIDAGIIRGLYIIIMIVILLTIFFGSYLTRQLLKQKYANDVSNEVQGAHQDLMDKFSRDIEDAIKNYSTGKGFVKTHAKQKYNSAREGLKKLGVKNIPPLK